LLAIQSNCSTRRDSARAEREVFAIDTTVLTLIAHYGVPIVALLVFASELGLPTGVPVRIALLLTGAYAIHSLPALLAGVILVTAACIFGTTSLHLIMRTGGVRLMDRLLARHREKAEQTMSRWQARLAGRDTVLVFIGRLLPLVRTYVTIGTGLLRIRLRSFIFGAAPAALIWSGVPMVAGFIVREDVQAFQARYASVSHVALALMPVAGLCTGLILWTRSGHSVSACLRRGRSGLGFVAALATTGYLIMVFWKNAWMLERGSGILPQPFVTLWIAALAALALLLLVFAYGDFRASFPQSPRRRFYTRGSLIANELIATTAWLTVLLAIGAIALRFGLSSPAL
jgi:membrane protein DedA with SNARE-associated domain